GKRARVLHALAWLAGTVSAIVMVLFAAILVIVHRPEDQSFDQQLTSHTSIRCAWAPPCSPPPAMTDSSAAEPALRTAASTLCSVYALAVDVRGRGGALGCDGPQLDFVNRRAVPAPFRGSKERSLSIGFYVNWDDNSYAAAKRTLPHLDWIIPGWLTLDEQAM